MQKARVGLVLLLGAPRRRGGRVVALGQPSLTPSQVRHAIDATATDLGRTGYDQRYGFGLVDTRAAVDEVGGHCCRPVVRTTVRAGPSGPAARTADVWP